MENDWKKRLGMVYSTNEDYDFEFTERFEETVVQFDYFSNNQSPDECDDGAADVKTMFDFATLAVTGDTFLRMVRSFSIPARLMTILRMQRIIFTARGTIIIYKTRRIFWMT